MFGNFDEEARKILVLAKKEMKELKHPYVGSEHLLLAILKDNNEISKKLRNYNLTYEVFKKELMNVIGVGSNNLNTFLYTPLLKRIMENAINDSKESDDSVTIAHLFSSMLEEGEGVAIRIMIGMGIDLEKLYQDFLYKVIVPKSKNKKMIVDDKGIDLVEKAKKGLLDPVIGRDNEIKRVIEILSRRSKNNPLLIGDAGVGKTAIVEGLSYLIANDLVPNSLKNKRVISVDMASLVAGTKYRGEFEERITKIIEEVEDSNVILFIDEIHTLVGAGGAEGAIDASNIFKPALARGKIKVIGATTYDEYKKTIANDKALSRRFQNVVIKTPDKKMTKEILLGIKPIYEKYHGVSISEDILNLIIDLCDKYIHDRYEPDKSIDILDEVCAYVSLKETKDLKEYNKIYKELKNVRLKLSDLIKKDDYKEALLTRLDEEKLVSKINDIELNISKKSLEVHKKDVAHILNMKTGIPIYELLEDNSKVIKSILKDLKENIKGQDEAVKKCIDIVKRIKLGFKDDKCYSMLFVGPTGVGKTRLATLFAECLNNNLIKLDGADYMDISSVNKILGSSPGYVGYMENISVLEEVKTKPFSTILIDNVDLMHPNIINIFYQILDEGKVKNAKGEYVYFTNSIIIMTTNVGFDEKVIGFNKNIKRDNLKENFNLSFINRLDSIIYFNTLDIECIEKIVKEKISQIKIKYKNKCVSIKINQSIIKAIIEKCDYEEYGARKIDKIINEDIESKIIDNIIEGKKNITISSLDNVVI